jgi:hypothetical protein
MITRNRRDTSQDAELESVLFHMTSLKGKYYLGSKDVYPMARDMVRIFTNPKVIAADINECVKVSLPPTEPLTYPATPDNVFMFYTLLEKAKESVVQIMDDLSESTEEFDEDVLGIVGWLDYFVEDKGITALVDAYYPFFLRANQKLALTDKEFGERVAEVIHARTSKWVMQHPDTEQLRFYGRELIIAVENMVDEWDVSRYRILSEQKERVKGIYRGVDLYKMVKRMIRDQVHCESRYQKMVVRTYLEKDVFNNTTEPINLAKKALWEYQKKPEETDALKIAEGVVARDYVVQCLSRNRQLMAELLNLARYKPRAKPW